MKKNVLFIFLCIIMFFNCSSYKTAYDKKKTNDEQIDSLELARLNIDNYRSFSSFLSKELTERDFTIKALRDSLSFFDNVRQKWFLGRIFNPGTISSETEPRKYKLLFQEGTFFTFVNVPESLGLTKGKFSGIIPYANIQVFSEKNELQYQLSFPDKEFFAFNNFIESKNLSEFSISSFNMFSEEFRKFLFEK